MTEENNMQDQDNDDILDDIANAVKDLEEAEDAPADLEGDSAAVEPDSESESTDAADADNNDDEPEKDEIEPAPNSWGKNTSEKWAELPAEVRAEIIKRENDVHKMATAQDQERLFGRDMKEIVNPYVPIITAAGSTPAEAIKNALNSMYVLHTGDQAAKQQTMREIAQTYGVDMTGLADQDDYVDPVIASLQDEIKQLRQVANPQNIDKTLSERMELMRTQSEIEAFASDPANVYFEQVRPVMAALVNAGRASNLKEAYDAACRADPAISSMLDAQKQKELQAKRKEEIAAKKRAASSVTGSPATSNASAANANNSVEDDLRAAFQQLSNAI